MNLPDVQRFYFYSFVKQFSCLIMKYHTWGLRPLSERETGAEAFKNIQDSAVLLATTFVISKSDEINKPVSIPVIVANESNRQFSKISQLTFHMVDILSLSRPISAPAAGRVCTAGQGSLQSPHGQQVSHISSSHPVTSHGSGLDC